MNRAEFIRLSRFLLLGGVAAAVNWVSRFGWSRLAVPFELAVLLAYVTGMAVAFMLFRLFVFPESSLPITTQARNFVLVNLVGICVSLLTAELFERGIFPLVGFHFHTQAISHAIAIATPVASSWFGHRHFTFAARQPAADA